MVMVPRLLGMIIKLEVYPTALEVSEWNEECFKQKLTQNKVSEFDEMII